MRTALSRSSGGYFFELTDFILPQQMKSPDPPGRFREEFSEMRRSEVYSSVEGFIPRVRCEQLLIGSGSVVVPPSGALDATGLLGE
ncbi:hypothetical protein ACW9HQ_24680 [Nocardia gipuzkoensis]